MIIYPSIEAIKTANQFSFEDIPDRIKRLFRKVLWDLINSLIFLKGTFIKKNI